MDNQHQRIHQTLLRLVESMRGPFPLETLGARLRLLETMAKDHFRAEESLMKEVRYPHLLPHRAEHGVMEERFHDLLDQYGSPDSPPLPGLGEAMSAMFLHHIETVDLDYAAFLERMEQPEEQEA